ncbi:MAG: class B sortase [Lachnospiraceae bacterium]|nr:class B sortase [Lachnospiraceae bacterium]
MNRGNKKWLVAFIAFIAVAVVALAVIIIANARMDRADRDYQALAEAVNTPAQPISADPQTQDQVPGDVSGDDTSSDDEGEIFYVDGVAMTRIKGIDVDVPYKELDWDELHELNPDIYAWICVPGTSVDYPVLQHPSDNNYYLNHNIDGSSGFPGCIYTEDYNSRDFTDPNTLIYGHNMDDDTMFSTLHNFRDPDMVKEDHYFFIYTEDRIYVYEIFAAYEYPSIHLILNYDYSNETVYEQYLRDVFNVVNKGMRVANVKPDIMVTTKDRIVTLSTCTMDHDSTKRFLVVGVLLDPKE